MDFRFSPKFKLEEINKDNVLDAFKDRIENYYFKPIRMLNDKECGFAAIGLLTSLIDILVKTEDHLIEHQSRTEYECWLREKLGFEKQDAKEFYKNFRCGLLHSGCIESGGQVSYETSDLYIFYKGHHFINPKILLEKTKHHFNEFIIYEKPIALFKYFKKKLDEID